MRLSWPFKRKGNRSCKRRKMTFLRNIAFIFVIAFLFAGLTSGVNMALSNRILLNEQTRLSRQLLEVLDIPFSADSSPELIRKIESQRIKSALIGQQEIYAGFSDTGVLERYAFPVNGKGLWGSIQGFVAMDKDLSRLEGLVFTSHVETPGLGARIDENWFREQFRGLDLSKTATTDRYVSIGSVSREGVNRLDSITGATITSNAVEKMLNRDIKTILSAKQKIRGIDWQSLPKK